MRHFLRSKIHNAIVTEANIEYVGSITIDKILIEKAGFEPGEKVYVWDVTNGERLETYIIEGAKNSGTICMNGAAAHKIRTGHKVIIAGFELTERPIKPTIVLVKENNQFDTYL
jgi:aspartate 1-decarboxylase